MGTWIRSHTRCLVNYGPRHWTGFPNSSTAEAALNPAVNARMAKKQQMRDSPCAVIDARLVELFRERYPMFRLLAPAMSMVPMDSPPPISNDQRKVIGPTRHALQGTIGVPLKKGMIE